MFWCVLLKEKECKIKSNPLLGWKVCSMQMQYKFPTKGLGRACSLTSKKQVISYLSDHLRNIVGGKGVLIVIRIERSSCSLEF